jgi:hypothetical protein
MFSPWHVAGALQQSSSVHVAASLLSHATSMPLFRVGSEQLRKASHVAGGPGGPQFLKAVFWLQLAFKFFLTPALLGILPYKEHFPSALSFLRVTIW